MRPKHSKIDIDNAKKIAREYCIQHGMDIGSLERQHVYVINGKVICTTIAAQSEWFEGGSGYTAQANACC